MRVFYSDDKGDLIGGYSIPKLKSTIRQANKYLGCKRMPNEVMVELIPYMARYMSLFEAINELQFKGRDNGEALNLLKTAAESMTSIWNLRLQKTTACDSSIKFDKFIFASDRVDVQFRIDKTGISTIFLFDL